MPVNVI
jgi:hypothetical protein